MPQEKVLRYEKATLENLDGGGLNEEFQSALDRVIGLFGEPQRFVVKGDQIVAEITMKIQLAMDVRTNAMDVAYRVGVKAPPARAFDSSVYLENGEILVEVSKQLELGEEPEDSSVTRLRAAPEGEGENGE